MSELQEARAKWLDAETRAVELQGQVAKLTHENFELRMKVYAAEFRAIAAENMMRGFLTGLVMK